MPVHRFEDKLPEIHPDAWIAPGAQVVGDVKIGAQSSIWHNAVVRGDVMSIRIGARSNIQDGSVVHVTTHTGPTNIGDEVLVGHMVMLHACTLMDRAFVGLGAIVMDDCVIESQGMLGAGALLTPGKRIRSGELWLGRPAKFVRMLSKEEMASNLQGIANYIRLAEQHRSSM